MEKICGGARIFEEASTAKERRTYRSNRRRLRRRKERINILQSLLLEDVEREYPNFFEMLRESSFDYEDKITATSILGEKYNLFSEKNFTDVKYYKQFPTIYHLRNYLINTTEKADIRLVYLAIHHIIKYRGNFLHEGNFAETTTEVENKLSNILNFLMDNYEIKLKTSKDKIFETLSEKNLSKANKKDEIVSYFDFIKEEKQVVANIISAFLGYQFDLSKIFEIELEKTKISFSSDIENEEEIREVLQDNAEIYDSMNTIYSWYILQDILKGRTYVSEAFIDKYKKYSNDLKLLKNVYKKYFPNDYKNMFRKTSENNYVAYNGKTSGKTCKKCKAEDFFKALEKKIEELPEDCKEKEIIIKEIKDNNFLRKINVIDNGAIPNQLHLKELKIILENQSKYYKTLAENKNNIIDLFSFRIPYYVGPLSNGKSNWSWIIRKSDVPIRPWNFKNIVDEDKASYALQELDKCMLTYDETISNFSTFFSTYLDNALITLSIKKSTDKRKIIYNEENMDNLNNLSYEDNYNCFDIDMFCKDNDLSNIEINQCKLLYSGYSIKEIAKRFNISVQYCYQLNKNIKNKLLNLV